jgi:hypothetical protein
VVAPILRGLLWVSSVAEVVSAAFIRSGRNSWPT